MADNRVSGAAERRHGDAAATSAAYEDRCDKCGTPKSEWATKPCVKSLTQSPRHTITRFYLDPPTRVENVWTGKP